MNVTSDNDTYIGNVLSECQLFIAEHGEELALCRSNLHTAKGLIEWRNTKDMKLSDIMKVYNYNYICNGDSMHHLNKGVFGIKIDGGSNITISNVQIKNINNESRLGSTIAGPYIYSHKGQSKISKGYTGCHARGISISSCNNIKLNSVTIDQINSDNGNSVGIDIFNSSDNTDLNYITISNICCGLLKNNLWLGIDFDGNNVSYTTEYPNKIPCCKGISIDNSSCIQNLQNIKINGNNEGPTDFIPLNIGNNISLLKKTFI